MIYKFVLINSVSRSLQRYSFNSFYLQKDEKSFLLFDFLAKKILQTFVHNYIFKRKKKFHYFYWN